MTLKQLVGLGKRLGLSTILFLSLPATIVKAQVVPDRSLPTIVEQLREIMKINSGQREGNNLFHSFEEFSIPQGNEAVFENALDIENIFTRITGESISNINGFIRTQGGANLFLVNPNGIVFGENAQLDIGGSFIATTGQSIQFEDGTEFAADAQEQPVLTVSVPIGVQFEGDSGAITISGSGHQIKSESLSQSTDVESISRGLQVNSRETLALIGNKVNLNKGLVLSDRGTIEIGSVQNGFVGVTEDLGLNYDDTSSFGTIRLEQQSLISVTDPNGDSITLRGADLSVSDGSKILVQNENGTSSGNLEANTSNSIVLEGTTVNGEVGSGIQAETTGLAQASNINLNTQKVLLRDGARISSNTYSEGSGGNVAINALDSVKILESSSNIINASTYASGNAGSVDLSTNDLIITEGGGISSSTLGTGEGGNLNVKAENVELIGNLSEPNSLSAISAVSFSPKGNAGSVKVDTDTLKIIDGGAVSTTSIGDGSAGNVSINASDSIEISSQTEAFPSAISSAVTARGDAEFRIQLGISEIPGGSSGNIDINTPSLQIVRGGEVSVENEGTGDAGTLTINSKKIDLNSDGSITATSASGQGGNINLQIDQLQLDENSSITATAENDGNGGNINITTRSLIAKKTLK